MTENENVRERLIGSIAGGTISRSVTSPNKMDSYVDLAGYAALGASLARG